MRLSTPEKNDVTGVDGATDVNAAKTAQQDDVEAVPVSPTIGEIDPAIEKRVRRKLDLHLVPLLSALYLLAFLDRSNIGFVLRTFNHHHNNRTNADAIGYL